MLSKLIYMETNLEDFIVKRSNIPKNFLKDFFNLGGDTYGDTYKNIDFDDVVKCQFLLCFNQRFNSPKV